MKKTDLTMVAASICAVLALGMGGVLGEATADESAIAEELATVEARTLNGEFAWNDRAAGPLEAVFEPTGENAWDVSFFFEFRGTPHTYTGTAEGNLVDGSLEGRVQNEDKRRTWEFSGSFEGETYQGEHWELIGDQEKRRPTGTLSLGS